MNIYPEKFISQKETKCERKIILPHFVFLFLLEDSVDILAL